MHMKYDSPFSISMPITFALQSPTNWVDGLTDGQRDRQTEGQTNWLTDAEETYIPLWFQEGDSQQQTFPVNKLTDREWVP